VLWVDGLSHISRAERWRCGGSSGAFAASHLFEVVRYLYHWDLDEPEVERIETDNGISGLQCGATIQRLNAS